MLKDSIIQYVKENTAKISLEELDTVLTAEAIAGFFQKMFDLIFSISLYDHKNR